MEKRGLTDNILNNINFDTYRKLNKFTSIGTISSNMAHWITVITGGGIEFLTIPSIAIFCILNILFNNDKNIYKTKDIKELMILYKQFLQNYNELNKLFEVKNPIEISTMYNYLLYKGYLSKDKKFEFSQDNVIDFRDFGGLNIFDGKGVCRHISLLLNDIFKEQGIKSEKISVYQREQTVDDNALNQFMNEFLEKTIQNIDAPNVLDVDYYRNGIKKSITLEPIDIKNIKRKQISNHAINYVEFDSVGYYLDATQDDIYQKQKNSLFLSDEVDESLYIVSNPKYNYLSSNTRKIDFKTSSNTKKICEDNVDVFEKFYKENKGLYEEIVTKSLILKPKKS